MYLTTPDVFTPLFHGYSLPAYGEPPATPRKCDNRGIPPREPVKPLFTPNRVACPNPVFGVRDPAGVIGAAVNRAVQMMDNTINELVNARTRVCQGEPPAWPVLGDLTAYWLKNRMSVCIDDIRVWTAVRISRGRH